MTMKEPEMRVIRCSDPEQNPAAGKLRREWLEETDLRSAEREAPVQRQGNTPAFHCFCRPLSEWNAGAK